MVSFEDLKYWYRSGSLSFMRNRNLPGRASLAAVPWKGKPLHYRPGTSDPTIIYRLLMKPLAKREYQLPEGLNPKVILDIGANIGVASVYLANHYPLAKIYSFEPAPDNFEILSRNVSGYPNIKAFPLALGRTDSELDLFFSDDANNFGGYSFYSAGVNPHTKVKVEVREVNRALALAGIDEIDLIKIDTEGAEFDILTSLAPEKLKRVSWILGELHGERDFELLAYLSQWFSIAVKKPLNSRLGLFEACRKGFDPRSPSQK